MIRKVDENELVAGCIKGNGNIQRMLYEYFAGKMMAVCIRYCKSRMEAEDVLQEGFIKVFDKIKTFRSEGSLEGWIKKIMINTALRNYHNTKYLYRVDDRTEQVVEAMTENSFSSIDLEELMKMIQSLPDGYRIVFNLYAIEGYSHKEISQKLGITEGTSKSQLSRARTLLQKMIEKQTSAAVYHEKIR